MATTPRFDVTLVIPVYNVEEFLPECLDSVASQTIADRIEVILVDDGSTDSSHEICAGFADRHPNVTVIRRTNGGLGAARNTGVENATAPYIAFLDSDDVLPPDSIARRLAAMVEDVEVVVGDMTTFPRATTWPWTRGVRAGARILSGIEEFPELASNASACNKLFRTDWVIQHPFPESVHFEDAFVVVPALLSADRIAIIPEVVYLYRKRATSDSIMDSLFTRPGNYWDHLSAVRAVRECSAGLSAERSNVARAFMARSMEGFLLRAPNALPREELRSFFDAARAVLGDLDPALIAAATRDLRHRIAYVAMIRDDFPLFADRDSRSMGIEVVDGVERLRVEAPRSAQDVGDLLRLSAPRAFAEHVHAQPSSGMIVLSGRLDLPGVPIRLLEGSMSVRVAARGKALSALAPVSIRAAHDARRSATTVSWECTVPVASLASGRTVPDFHVRAGEGQFSIRLRPATGLLRSAREHRAKGGRFRVEAWETDRMAFLVQRRIRRGTRMAWRARVLLDDLASVVRRAPFSGWRIARLLTLAIRMGRPIWLIGERGDTAQDNGYQLFTWLRSSGAEVRARYVLDAKSTAWNSLGSRRGLVRRGGVRHRLLLLHARVLASSQDIDAYMLPRTWNRRSYLENLAMRLEHRRVFLQHGVIYNDVGPRLARGVTGLDVFVCTSPQEQGYLRATTDYTSELVLTGLPRFDTLKPRLAGRRILIAPTWRQYLVLPSYRTDGFDPGTFAGSDYESYFTRLLSDPELVSLLERHDLTLTFIPHYEVASHFARIAAGRSLIEVVPEPGPRFQDLLRSSAVFVTDYSSIMFDAAYAGIPVVQTPFDIERFHSDHYGRGWLDSTTDDLWPTPRTISGVVAELRRILEGEGAPISAERQSRIDGIFAHHDTENTRRVFEAIQAATHRTAR